MIEIVPAILTDDPRVFLEAAQRLVEAGVRRVHLDIGDGSFIPMKTISGFQELMDHDVPLDWDVHLMVSRPEELVDHWWGVPRADRFFIHVESTDMFGTLAEHVHGHGKRIGASVNPNTERGLLESAAGHADLVQFMTVIPGRQGGQFLPRVLDHVAEFHKAHPDMELCVDGGVTPGTAPLCVAAGANILVSGSYVLGSADIGQALKELRDAAMVQ